ncbi:MAG: TIGR03936 family radical SAM-associated protein [Planctomycetota bacterium]
MADQERYRVAAWYTLDGDLRFLSHHDELRLLARALVRAGWPLRYSQGFNPLPRMSLPLPRRVGIASECQLAVVELRAESDTKQLTESLAAVLPAQCTLREILAPLPPGKPHARVVEYVVPLSMRDARTVAPRLPALLEREHIIVQRRNYNMPVPRQLDIRPFIELLGIDGSVLRMRLEVIDQRSARPSEIITELGLAADAYTHRVRRTAVNWDMELTSTGGAPVPPKGIDLGNEKEISHH